jgi:hypothetical protein
VPDECKASGHAAGKSRTAADASSSEEEDDEQSDEGDELIDEGYEQSDEGSTAGKLRNLEDPSDSNQEEDEQSDEDDEQSDEDDEQSDEDDEQSDEDDEQGDEDDEQGDEDDEQSDEDETDLFLQALLNPNKHAQRLLKVRTQIADLCRVRDICRGIEIPARDILRSVVESFGLLRKAGLIRDSLIMLVDDPHRVGVAQAVELDIDKIERLERYWRTKASSEPPMMGSHDAIYQAAQRLLGMLGLMGQHTDPQDRSGRGRVSRGWPEQIKTFAVMLALATASYAGSHCHSLCEPLVIPKPGSDAVRYLFHAIAIRSCHFACLGQYIGGPVWVFGKGRSCENMILSITKEQFDDLWGPVTALVDPSNAQNLALQTEGGFLSIAIPSRKSHLTWETRIRKNEIPMHWTPARPGCRSLPPGVRLDSVIDLNSTMLIGFGEQMEDSACHKKPADISCFAINLGCTLNANAHKNSIGARGLEYVGTVERRWNVDTKALTLTAGWGGTSIGTNRTWKLRPAVSWKAAILMRCSQTGNNITPFMDLRVGLVRSMCTGNAERVSLLAALKLAFPKEQKDITDLLDSIKSNKTDESSR